VDVAVSFEAVSFEAGALGPTHGTPMHGMPMHGGMSHGVAMPMMSLPTWVQIAGVVLFLAVAALHLRHALGKQLWTRVWHGAHELMAFGMIAMLVPAISAAVSGALGAGLFGLAAVLGLVRAGFEAVPARRWLWVLTAVDLGAMAYMFALPGLPWLTWLLAAWLLVQAAGWAVRFLVPVEEGGSDHRDLPLRASLVVMDLGMVAMLVGMQLAMSAMPAMHGMS